MMTTRDDQCLNFISHQTSFPDTFPQEEPAEDLGTNHGVEDSLVDLKRIEINLLVGVILSLPSMI